MKYVHSDPDSICALSPNQADGLSSDPCPFKVLKELVLPVLLSLVVYLKQSPEHIFPIGLKKKILQSTPNHRSQRYPQVNKPGATFNFADRLVDPVGNVGDTRYLIILTPFDLFRLTIALTCF